MQTLETIALVSVILASYIYIAKSIAGKFSQSKGLLSTLFWGFVTYATLSFLFGGSSSSNQGGSNSRGGGGSCQDDNDYCQDLQDDNYDYYDDDIDDFVFDDFNDDDN